jgi:hypothetical protein
MVPLQERVPSSLADMEGGEPVEGVIENTESGDAERPEAGATAEDEPVREPPLGLNVDDVLTSSLDRYFLELNRTVMFEDVEFDVHRKYGQIRKLSPLAWEKKVKQFTARPPKEPLKVTLWPKDVQSMFK